MCVCCLTLFISISAKQFRVLTVLTHKYVSGGRTRVCDQCPAAARPRAAPFRISDAHNGEHRRVCVRSYFDMAPVSIAVSRCTRHSAVCVFAVKDISNSFLTYYTEQPSRARGSRAAVRVEWMDGCCICSGMQARTGAPAQQQPHLCTINYVRLCAVH